MRYHLAICICLSLFILGACHSETSSEARDKFVVIGSGSMATAFGKPLGIARLERDGETLAIRLTVAGLEPGVRAFHLHETGVCEAPDFMSAGGHLNPFGRTHGKLSEGGKHLGDLPNLEVGPSGSVERRVAFEDDSAHLIDEIFDSDGTAVILHARPDDYITDPTGAAGPRIACAVIARPA